MKFDLRYRSVRPSDLGQVARAFVSLIAIDLALRLSFKSVLERADRHSAERAVGPEELARARAYARWIDVAARHHFVRARCLHRSIALHQRLRKDGLPSLLRLGVRGQGGDFAAHAWVELAGEVVNDRAELVRPFSPLSGAPARGSSTPAGREVLQWP